MILPIQIYNLHVPCGGLVREIATPVQIGNAFSRTGSFVPLNADELKAVWDTGAMGTTITKELANRFSLPVRGSTLVYGVNDTAPVSCNTFIVSLMLPNRVIIPEIEVSECDGSIGCDVLIGMDIITRGDFAISNYNGETCFNFRIPSAEKFDFTQHPPRGSNGNFWDKTVGRNAPCPCGSGKKFKRCCGA